MSRSDPIPSVVRDAVVHSVYPDGYYVNWRELNQHLERIKGLEGKVQVLEDAVKDKLASKRNLWSGLIPAIFAAVVAAIVSVATTAATIHFSAVDSQSTPSAPPKAPTPLKVPKQG